MTSILAKPAPLTAGGVLEGEAVAVLTEVSVEEGAVVVDSAVLVAVETSEVVDGGMPVSELGGAGAGAGVVSVAGGAGEAGG